MWALMVSLTDLVLLQIKDAPAFGIQGNHLTKIGLIEPFSFLTMGKPHYLCKVLLMMTAVYCKISSFLLINYIL